MSTLQFDFDWLDMPGRAEPTAAATLARLTIRAGEIVATRVFDKRARTVREWIVTPLAPIAEWIAAHWWSLLEETVTPARSTAEFGQRHLLRTAEEGFVLPSLELFPEGDTILIVCEPRRTRFAAVDFESRGAQRLPTSGVRDALTSFVDAVVARVAQSGIVDAPFASLWEAVRQTSAEEAEFCRLAGRLGLNPYDLDDATSGKLLAMAKQLDPPLLDDLSWSVSASNLDSSFAWLLRGLDSLRASRPPPSVPLPPPPVQAAGTGPPWMLGYALADEFRMACGLPGAAPFDLDLVFHNEPSFIPAATNPVGLHALVNRRRDSEPLIYTATSGSASRRFLQARSLCACWARPEATASLLTAARTSWQQQSRAFAAELLAPRDFLRLRLTTDVVSEEQIEDLAAELDVSPWVVAHQIRNHGIAQIESMFEAG